MTSEKTRDELDKYDDNLSKLFDFIRSQYNFQSFVFVGTHCDSCEQTRVFISSEDEIDDPAAYLNDAIEVLEHEIDVMDSDLDDDDDEGDDTEAPNVQPSEERKLSELFVHLGDTVHTIPRDEKTEDTINGPELREWTRITGHVNTPGQQFVVVTHPLQNLFVGYSPFITVVLAVFPWGFKQISTELADTREHAVLNHLKSSSMWLRSFTVVA